MSQERKTSKITIPRLRKMKADGRRITMLTAYDYTLARLVDAAGIDIILVGDSLGMVMLGHETTLPVTMRDVIHHTKAVGRACKRAMLVADMPFMSYQVSPRQALRNAGRLVKEAGAEAVKLEGGAEVAKQVKAIVEAGIPVMGHLGLTPQSIHQMGGYRLQGKSAVEAAAIVEDALALQEAGAFSIVLEVVPRTLAAEVTAQLKIPTIGIGAGPDCDGQVLVLQDMLGLYTEMAPRHVKRYANLAEVVTSAVETYAREVREGQFPTEAQSFGTEGAETKTAQPVVPAV